MKLGFFNYLFRYPSFNIWILALFFTADKFPTVTDPFNLKTFNVGCRRPYPTVSDGIVKSNNAYATNIIRRLQSNYPYIRRVPMELSVEYTIHCFHLVESQETPVIIQSPPPPPPPRPSPPPPPPPVKETTKTARVAPQPSPVTDVTKPLLPPPQKNPPRRLPQPPPPQLPPPSRPPIPPWPLEKSMRDGLNKGEIVGVVFVGLIAMLQVLLLSSWFSRKSSF